MARRLLFGSALVLITFAAGGSFLAWMSGGEAWGWVAVFAIVSGAAFVFAITLALRDLLQGTWAASRERKSQIAELGALVRTVGELRHEVATRDSAISINAAATWDAIDKLERTQVETIGTALDRIERAQVESIGTALDRIELAQVDRAQVETIATALDRIERVQRDELRVILKEVRREQDAGYRQIESHITLMAAMNLRSPLPPMRRTWAIAPDSAAFLVQTIFAHNVRSVLEVGSGLSTVLVAQALRMTEQTQFTSLEQDPIFLRKTRALLRAERLEELVNLVEAPLKDTTIGDSVWQWYDEEAVQGLEGLDLVIVDGPPGRTGHLARYPALPMVASKLNEGALIFLDDARRDDEVEVVKRWIEEFPVVALDVPELEKGVALLQWKPLP